MTTDLNFALGILKRLPKDSFEACFIVHWWKLPFDGNRFRQEHIEDVDAFLKDKQYRKEYSHLNHFALLAKKYNYLGNLGHLSWEASVFTKLYINSPLFCPDEILATGDNDIDPTILGFLIRKGLMTCKGIEKDPKLVELLTKVQINLDEVSQDRERYIWLAKQKKVGRLSGQIAPIRR